MTREITLLTAVSLLAFAGNADAYLDPSTGTMLISAIVGIFASVALAMKTYWYKLKSLFAGKSRKKRNSNGPQTG